MSRYIKENISLTGDFRPETVFLAEGLSEAHFIERVLELEGATDACIFILKGVNRLSDRIRLLTDQDNFMHVRSMGVMVDANDNPASRFRAAVRGFQLAGFPNDSEQLMRRGVLRQGDKISGIFVSPGNGEKGKIEDLVLSEIEESAISGCVKEFEQCAMAQGETVNKKGLVQMYISTRKGDLCGLGRAFEARIFDVRHPAYKDAYGCIKRLL